MQLAFELTPDDTLAVLIRLGLPTDEASVSRAFGLVTSHQDRIIRAALYGEDLETQTQYALDDIENLLRDRYGLPPRAPLTPTGAS